LAARGSVDAICEQGLEFFHLFGEAGKLAIKPGEAISLPSLNFVFCQGFWEIFGFIVQQQCRQALVIKDRMIIREMTLVGVSNNITEILVVF